MDDAFEGCGDIVFEVLSSAPLAILAGWNTQEVILGKGYEELYPTNWSGWISFKVGSINSQIRSKLFRQKWSFGNSHLFRVLQL